LEQETVSGSGISWAICICTSLQTDNHASTPQLSFLQGGCPSCRPTNSVKALKGASSQEKLPSVGGARLTNEAWLIMKNKTSAKMQQAVLWPLHSKV